MSDAQWTVQILIFASGFVVGPAIVIASILGFLRIKRFAVRGRR